MMRIFFITLVLLVSSARSAAALDVLTSIKPIQLITNELTLGVSSPEVLLGLNTSPHDYALKPSDVKRIHNAQLVIWFGRNLEPFLDKILQSQPEVLTISQIEGLPLRQYDSEHEDDGHNHGSTDPHFWLGIAVAKETAKAISAKLVELDPEHRQQYEDNLKKFLSDLAKTDQQIALRLAPVAKQPYFVFHDAYGYFEEHFGLTNIGHFTVSPERKPGAKTLIKIRTQLANHQAKCVFSEPQFQPAVIKTVIGNSPVSIGVLDPLATQIEVKKGGYFEFLKGISESYYGCLAK
jgi:zinc transport system substrate-binding protein